MGLAYEIAIGIGEVLRIDDINDSPKDPRFYKGITSVEGWEPSLSLTPRQMDQFLMN
jgi:hypothetical protein